MFPNDIGDFEVFDSQTDRAREFQAERSEESRSQDRAKRAPVTTNLQMWKSNPDRYDFPGIDTPSENPNVLPKDLKDPAPARTTSKIRDKAPIDPVERTERDYQRERLGSLDLSLAPQEVFRGVGAESRSNRGISGPRFNTDYGIVETDRIEEEQNPPESALKYRESKEKDTLATQKTPASDVAFIFENTDTDASLDLFRQTTKRVKREMSGLADDFTAAEIAAQKLEER